MGRSYLLNLYSKEISSSLSSGNTSVNSYYHTLMRHNSYPHTVEAKRIFTIVSSPRPDILPWRPIPRISIPGVGFSNFLLALSKMGMGPAGAR